MKLFIDDVKPNRIERNLNVFDVEICDMILNKLLS